MGKIKLRQIEDIDYSKIKNTPDIPALALQYALPIGAIIMYGGATNFPDGYLSCDGSSVSKETYADLYAVIGTAYGTSTDDTKFVLPNLVNRFVIDSDTEDDSLVMATTDVQFLIKATNIANLTTGSK